MSKATVASDELRRAVEGFKRKGLPPAISLEQADPSRTKEQVRILKEIGDLGEEERKVAHDGQQPRRGSRWWQVRERARAKLQEAVLAGLGRLRFVQEHAIGYGAIPDPNEGWRYYKLPNGYYACWTCGSEIQAKEVSRSVHFSEFSGLAGGGEVRHETVPWCPNCEKEPSSHGGFIRETVAESIAREMR